AGREVEVHRHRRVALAPRLRDHGVAHGLDRLGQPDRAADLVRADDAHQARIRFTVDSATLRPEITATAGEGSAPERPVRIAATVTADEGSIRYWCSASRKRTAPKISSSVSSATASARVRRTPKPVRPMPPSRPPAVVATGGRRVMASPFSRERASAGELASWQPTTWQSGSLSFA